MKSLILSGFRIVNECKLDLSVSLLQSFYGFAVNWRVLGRREYMAFAAEVVCEVVELGRERWQFLRGVTLHVVKALIRMKGNEEFLRSFVKCIVELAACTELRGKDSDLHYPDLFAYLHFPTRSLFPSNSSETGHTSQFILLSYLHLHPPSPEVLLSLTDYATNQLLDIDSRKIDMPNTPSLRRKVALTQLLVTIAPFFPCQNADFVTNFSQKWLKILQFPISSFIRYYIEKLLVYFGLQNSGFLYPSLQKHLQNGDLKAQFGASVLFISGILMVKREYLREELLTLIVPFMGSNVAVLRRTAHFVIMNFAAKVGFSQEKHSKEFLEMVGFMHENSDLKRMEASLGKELEDYDSLGTVGLEVVSQAAVNEFGAYLPDPILDRIDGITTEIMSESRVDDFAIRIDEFWLLEAGKHTLAPSSANYQRKPTPSPLVTVSSRGNYTRHRLIILGVYVKSPYTLAGLTRTGEVFAAKQLVYSDLDLVNSVEFRQMAVTAEKWVPMVAIDRKDIEDFIKRRKRQGYEVFLQGKEGSEAGEMPERSVLIPVEEGVQVSSEVTRLVDCKVRRTVESTHVAASLWIWEYTRRNYVGR